MSERSCFVEAAKNTRYVWQSLISSRRGRSLRSKSATLSALSPRTRTSTLPVRLPRERRRTCARLYYIYIYFNGKARALLLLSNPIDFRHTIRLYRDHRFRLTKTAAPTYISYVYDIINWDLSEQRMTEIIMLAIREERGSFQLRPGPALLS